MKSDFEKWADSFYDDRFKSPNAIDHILFKIEDGSKYGAETGVYKCQESYFIPHESSIFYTTPVYMKGQLRLVLAQAGVAENARAEALVLEDFAAIANHLP